MPDVGHRSIDGDDVAGDREIAVHFIQLVVALDVFRVRQLELLSLLARAPPTLLNVNQRPIVPIDLRLQHVVLLFEKRIRRLDVAKLIFGY